MKTIVCHPSNWEAVKAKINRGHFDGPGVGMFDDFTVKTNPHMDRDKPTGRYTILASEKTVEKDKLQIKESLVEYGPEDIDWLLYSGRVTEEREMLFFVVNESLFRMRYESMPILPSRTILLNTTA